MGHRGRALTLLQGCATLKVMLFSDERRILLAKTIMDLAKGQAAAAFATAFFRALAIEVRVLMALMFLGLLVAGFLVQPENRERKERNE